MTAIWVDTEDGQWEELSPAGFSLEDHLQSMVFRSVGMLPLSGSPVVVALAREVEVPLTKGRVDVVAIEANGTPVLIEVKLKANQEARKAVAAQLLSYAASLRGTSLPAFVTRLANAGFAAPTVSQALLDTAISEGQFNDALAANLVEGRFRLVLVLDDAPPELVRLVGYLEAISGGLLAIDLITVSTFKVDNRTVAVPQRIDPQHYAAAVADNSTLPNPTPVLSEPGLQLFESSIPQAPAANQASLQQMADWAKVLANEGIASLISRQGPSRTVITARVKNEDAGLSALWNDNGQPYVWLHGTVLSRLAPLAAAKLQAIFGKQVGFRMGIRWQEATQEILDTLREGYREAAGP